MFTRLRARDDQGVAMITVIMVMAVVVALGAAAVMVSATNIKNAGRDRFATTAQGAAEAAIAAAESYLQTISASALTCSPSCSSNAWGNSASPQALTFPGGRTASVWIELKQAYNPPTYKSSDYVIHAVGRSSSSIGVRTLDQEVSVSPLDFPFGIYIDTQTNVSGNASVTNESVFSRSCIANRNLLNMQGIDPYYGIPAAAHSAQYITTANQSTCDTSMQHEQMTDSKAEHYDPTGGSQHNYCTTTVGTGSNVVTTTYDQDSLGGLFSQASNSQCSGAANQYTTTSYFDNTQLSNPPYDFQPKGLTDAQYAALASVAKAEGFYYTNTSSITFPTASQYPNAVMYFDLNPNTASSNSVNVGSGDVASYAWVDELNGACTQQHPSIIIIVRYGALTLASGVHSTGAIFTPEGTITVGGNVDLVGTIFAQSAKINGGANIHLNSCYIKNIPGPITSVTPLRFHENDS